MAEAARAFRYLFHVGHSNKTLLSTEFVSRSAKLIERNGTKHKEEIAWAPAPLRMG